MSVEAVSRLVSRPAGVSRGRCHKHPSNHGYMTKINSPILGLAWKGAPIAKLVWGHLPHLGYQGSNPLPARGCLAARGPRSVAWLAEGEPGWLAFFALDRVFTVSKKAMSKCNNFNIR